MKLPSFDLYNKYIKALLEMHLQSILTKKDSQERLVAHISSKTLGNFCIRNSSIILLSSEGNPLARLQSHGITFLASEELLVPKNTKGLRTSLFIFKSKKNGLAVQTGLESVSYRPGLFVDARNGLCSDTTLWDNVGVRAQTIENLGKEVIDDYKNAALTTNQPIHINSKAAKTATQSLESFEKLIKTNVGILCKDLREPDETDEIRVTRIPEEPLGTYLHYKGGRYLVTDTPRYETGPDTRKMIYYHRNDDSRANYVREWDDFFAAILHPTGTGVMRRFEKE
jgi:hypothetical protein